MEEGLGHPSHATTSKQLGKETGSKKVTEPALTIITNLFSGVVHGVIASNPAVGSNPATSSAASSVCKFVLEGGVL